MSIFQFGPVPRQARCLVCFLSKTSSGPGCFPSIRMTAKRILVSLLQPCLSQVLHLHPAFHPAAPVSDPPHAPGLVMHASSTQPHLSQILHMHQACVVDVMSQEKLAQAERIVVGVVALGIHALPHRGNHLLEPLAAAAWETWSEQRKACA